MDTSKNALVRAALAAPLAAALALGTAACAAETDAELGEREFTDLQDDYAELEERVGVLEDEAGS